MDLDWRLILFEAINFLVLMALLGRFLFRPLRRVMDERREGLVARDREAEAREAAADVLRVQLEQRLAGLEEEAQRLRAKGHEAGEQEAQRLLAEGRHELDRLRRQTEEDLELARRAALTDLREEIRDVAIEAATRVVRGMHDASLTGAYAREGARRLKQSRELSAEDVVQVRCDPDANVDEVRALIEAELGPGPAVEVTPDSALTAGVVLTTRDIEVDAHAAASLSAWEAELIRQDEEQP